MRLGLVHRTATIRLLLGAAAVCTCAGCWEEIHYTGPPGDSPSKQVAEREVDEPAEQFADELQRSIEPAPPSDLMPEIAPPDPEPSDPFADQEALDDYVAEITAAAPASPLAADLRENTRRLAWLLGTKLSLAALANDRGSPPEEVAKWFGESASLAELLGTSLAELPPRSVPDDNQPSLNAALDYLFTEGRVVGNYLAERRGDDHAALFELAIKSNVLLALYRPGAPVVGALVGAIRNAGSRAGLPAELWQPLVDQLDVGAPAAAVQEEVFVLHAKVDRHLGAAAIR